MSVIDLRACGELSIEDAKAITKIEKTVREEYNQYICKLVGINNVKGSQWFLRATCRNTYVSKIHDAFCRLALLQHVLTSGRKIDTILIDRSCLQQPLQELLKQCNCVAQIRVCGSSRVRSLQTIRNIMRSLYFTCNIFFWPKILGKKKKPKQSVILLDMFLFKNSFDKSCNLKDRYYPDLITLAPEEEKNKIWYLPSLYNMRSPLDWARMFRNIANSPQNILVKEQWLTLSDYAKALLQSLSLPRSIHTMPRWRNLDVTAVVREELTLDMGSPALVQALLTEKSLWRYKLNNIQIHGVIDWFENQVGDRALDVGLRKWYPSVYIKGYLGFVPEGYYAGLAPVQCEQDGGVLPDELLLMGEAYIERQSKYVPTLRVHTAPAFRFQETIQYAAQASNKKEIVVLAMPMLLDEAERIIHMALQTVTEGTEFVIKTHPTISIEKFKQAIPSSTDVRFTFTDEPIVELLQTASLLVTSASSTALEAVLCSVCVAILGCRSGPTINPLEGIVDEEFWSICYTPKALEMAILAKKPEKSVPVAPYFVTPTLQGVLELLRFETH
jgi:hypothetical protein